MESWTDEELVTACRSGSPDQARAGHGELYSRYRQRVAAWCYRISGDTETAADLAQEVFLRVQERIGSFRGESLFSTWLYTVTRSIAINQGIAAKRRDADPLDDVLIARLEDPSPGAEELTERGEILERFRSALRNDLDPLELRVLYLHFGLGVSVRAITELLGLTNRSGAKAQLVSAKRKLGRRFGRWLSAQGRRPADKSSATGDF